MKSSETGRMPTLRRGWWGLQPGTVVLTFWSRRSVFTGTPTPDWPRPLNHGAGFFCRPMRWNEMKWHRLVTHRMTTAPLLASVNDGPSCPRAGAVFVPGGDAMPARDAKK
jgi:hypothetical protein